MGRRLRYPIGVADFEDLTGKPFDLEAFKEVRILYLLGDQDVHNDPVYYRDCFSKEDEALIVNLFGATRPERWPVSEAIYRSAGHDAIFRLYQDVAHKWPKESKQEMAQFFKDNM